VQFTGHEYPPAVAAERVDMLGRDVPAGHRVIGVVTASCETLNGASGLLDRPCNEDALMAVARERAAAAGGTGLVDDRCAHVGGQRILSNVDGGGVETAVRASLSCQATVVRRVAGAMVGVAGSAARPAGAKRRVTLSGIDVEVSFTGTARAARARDDVGELDAVPSDHLRMGRLSAECQRGCSRSVARRALKDEGGRVGALAVADVACELIGDRWRCEAEAIGGSESVSGDAAGAD
jgi:hypothetical protein